MLVKLNKNLRVNPEDISAILVEVNVVTILYRIHGKFITDKLNFKSEEEAIKFADFVQSKINGEYNGPD